VPGCPLEFCFLADWFFQRVGIRDRVELTYVTPLDGAFTKPVAAKALAGLLEEKGVALVTEFNTGEVDGSAGRLISYDGREVGFDLAVVVPLHGGASYVARSPGLVMSWASYRWMSTRCSRWPSERLRHRRCCRRADVQSRLGHSFRGEILVENVRRFLAGEPLDGSFDGHTNCFIETGFGKALLIDFNYDTEPLPGHFPTSVGLPLLKESRLNHLGKLMFQPLYWHSLLPGHDLPGVVLQCPPGKHIQSVP